jgi:hypothetical protein
MGRAKTYGLIEHEFVVGRIQPVAGEIPFTLELIAQRSASRRRCGFNQTIL